MRTIGMSDYTVGEDCFDELPGALAEYGATKVAIIGGKRALAAALPGIEAVLEGTDVEILETRVYGTNSTRANIAKVRKLPHLPGSRRAYRMRRRQGARHHEDGGHRAQEDRLYGADDLLQLLGRDRHCRRLQRRRLARGLFVPQPPRAHLHQPQDHRRAPAEYFWAAWAMPCPSSPRSSTPRAPATWSTPQVLAWRSHTPAPSAVYLWRAGSEDVARTCRPKPSSRSRSISWSTRATSPT